MPWENAAVAYVETMSTGRMIIDLKRSSLAMDAYLDVRARLTSEYELWRITSITVRRDRDQVEKEFARMTKLDPPTR